MTPQLPLVSLRGLFVRCTTPDKLIFHAIGRQLLHAIIAKEINKYATTYYEKEPHLEGEQYFGNNKQKLIDALDVDNEYH